MILAHKIPGELFLAQNDLPAIFFWASEVQVDLPGRNWSGKLHLGMPV